MRTTKAVCSSRGQEKGAIWYTSFRFKYLLVVIPALAILISSPALAGGSSSDAPSRTFIYQRALPVEIIEHPEFMEKHFASKTDGCAIRWIVYKAEVNSGVIKHLANCPTPLESQYSIIAAILDEIVSDESIANVFHTLFWGRLFQADQELGNEMAFRLALAAHRSDLWDSDKGKPVTGNHNEAVVKIANQVMIYPEIDRLFTGFHRTARLSGAEKVIVKKADTLPFFERLKKHGVHPEEILPVDAMVWFAISGNK
ncbi:MAG: hypothetical protein HKM93_02735 [Desulfobacteraceae bacterium]|nr:hypothetical protein [Desulfobacteraceae bacterium]